MASKKYFLIAILTISSAILGVFLGIAYSQHQEKEQLQTRFRECSTNVKEIEWPSLLNVFSRSQNGILSITYQNKSTCYDFNKVTTDVVFISKGVPDTVSLTLKEIVYAGKKVTIDVRDIKFDSAAVLQSLINVTSINF